MSTTTTEATATETGSYLYCVAESGEAVHLGQIGLDGSEVYTIVFRDICAVVHDCPAQPYQSRDSETVQAWALAHQRVIDSAMERWATVLPFAFDTIIKGDPDGNVREKVLRWLEQDYESLRRKKEKIRGKAEYGIQIFWEPKTIARSVVTGSPDIQRLEEEIRSKPKGLAYMYRQRLENMLKKEMEARADRCFQEFYERIRRHVDDIHIEKVKKPEGGSQMLANFSCLVSEYHYAQLSEDLGNIDGLEGFSVRFTGPWPPYSFVRSA